MSHKLDSLSIEIPVIKLQGELILFNKNHHLAECCSLNSHTCIKCIFFRSKNSLLLTMIKMRFSLRALVNKNLFLGQECSYHPQGYTPSIVNLGRIQKGCSCSLSRHFLVRKHLQQVLPMGLARN